MRNKPLLGPDSAVDLFLIIKFYGRFAEAIASGRVSKVEQIPDCCILAAVGQQMASRKGVAATMFAALAKANINIR